MARLGAEKCKQHRNAHASLSEASVRIVKLLVGRPPTPVSQLMKAAGVSRTAIVEPLNELIECGFAERHVDRLSGRGRPRYVYAATSAALPFLFPSREQRIVAAMWKAARDIGGQELVCELVKRSAAEMVRHYQSRITAQTAEGRVHQMARLLQEKGHVAEVGRGEHGLIVLRNRSCPFIGMLEEDRFVCRVGILTMSELFGCPMRQVASRLDGAPCCVFEISLQAREDQDAASGAEENRETFWKGALPCHVEIERDRPDRGLRPAAQPATALDALAPRT